ncbi:hypothetical protein J6590_027670 [Homalodisca vitripennis]|nr:hypothetical protein J6590_027670 [Homalodisca vitripennis]
MGAILDSSRPVHIDSRLQGSYKASILPPQNKTALCVCLMSVVYPEIFFGGVWNTGELGIWNNRKSVGDPGALPRSMLVFTRNSADCPGWCRLVVTPNDNKLTQHRTAQCSATNSLLQKVLNCTRKKLSNLYRKLRFAVTLALGTDKS